MAKRRDTSVRQPPKRARGIGFGILGALLTVTSLGSLLIGVNAIGYLMGAGEPVRITVTEDSVDTEEGGEFGAGYFEAEGERVYVTLPYVEKGETVTARKEVIQWLPTTKVITNKSHAKENLQFLIGFVVLGVPGVVILFGGWIFLTGRYTPKPKPFPAFGSRPK